MFYINTAARNIARQKYKSVLSFFICIIIVLLLNVYIGNIDSVNKQLARLPEAMPVNARVSNQNGSMDTQIAIKREVVDGLLTSPRVKEPIITTQLIMGFGEITVEDYSGDLNLFATAANDFRGIGGLKEEELKLSHGTSADFFASTGHELLMEEYLMEEYGLKVGDVLDLTAFYNRYKTGSTEIFFDPLIYTEYTIVGSFNIAEYTGSAIPPSILLSLPAVINDFDEAGLEFTADSASFQAQNPFELNALKEEMQELGLLSVSPGADFAYDGKALTIRDSTFIQAAEQLTSTATLLAALFPFIVAIVIFIGYITAYLLLHSRRSEYAVMRSLGMRQSECFRVLLLENACLQLLGVTVGSLAAGLVFAPGTTVLAAVAAIFLLCHLSGAAIALWSIGRLSVMEVLTKTD